MRLSDKSSTLNFFILENSLDNFKTLADFPIGARLLVRTKKDWRVAVVSQFHLERVTLIVCSPNGKTYRLRRGAESEIVLDGEFPILKIEIEENWRDNFSKYDFRW